MIDDTPLIKKKLIKSGSIRTSDQFIISSVFPKMTSFFIKLIHSVNPSAYIHLIGRSIFPRVIMRYDPKRLGADRLVNLYGAMKLYQTPVLVIDFGTAITFDYVSKRGIFEGGLIVPGIELSGKALCDRAALIPRLKRIQSARRFLGRTTDQALQSGLFNGFGALADGLIKRFKDLSKARLTVLATGGFAKQIAPYVRGFDKVDLHHTLRSLVMIYEDERKQIA